MRKLVWAAMGFAAAALAAEYFLPVSGLPYLAAALAICSAAGLLLRGGRRRAVMTLVLAAAAGLLCWWGRYQLFVAPCEALTGQTLTVTARVTDYPFEGDGYTGLSVRITDGAPRVRAYLYSYDDSLPSLEPGDTVSVPVRVLSAMETAAHTRRHTHTALGRSLLGRTAGAAAVTGRGAAAWLYFPQRLAASVETLCERLFPQDAVPFVKALMTGDKSDLYAEASMYGDMRASGVLHIVAVSGMHIVILVTFLQMLMGRSRHTSLICIPVMTVFVLMTGCGPSAVRAAVMQSVLLLAPVAEREYDGPASLAAALMVILLVNPMAVGGTGFQLSFACVLGFIVLSPGLQSWCRRRLRMDRRVVRAAANSVVCTVCATAFSLPLAAYYFGVIPLLSWLANLLTLLPAEICFAGAYVVCAVGAVLEPLGAALAWVLSWIIRYCLLVYRLIASLPFACLYTVRGAAVLWMAFAYILFFGWYCLERRGRRVTPLIPAALCVMGAAAVFLTAGLPLRGAAEFTALDVGQGACGLIADGSAAVVVDCGGNTRKDPGDLAADYLLSEGKERVDVLILTHLHRDHTNGVKTLMARLPVGLLVLPEDADDPDGTREEILEAAARQDTQVLLLTEETTVRAGDMALTLLLPEAGSGANERGIVVHARLGTMDALLMGDAGQNAERALMERGCLRDVDVVFAGHHGSADASGMLFLRAAAPETAVISVGAGNPYGQPAEETLRRLTECGAAVYRTDTDGTVTIRQRRAE